MLAKHIPEHAIEIRVPGNLSLDLVSRSVYQMMDERFYVFQIVHLVDAEYDEAVPLPRVPVFEMPVDAPELPSDPYPPW